MKEVFMCREKTTTTTSTAAATTTTLDDCHSKHCENGGVCVNIDGWWICLCKTDFKGSNCKIDMKHSFDGILPNRVYNSSHRNIKYGSRDTTEDLPYFQATSGGIAIIENSFLTIAKMSKLEVNGKKALLQMSATRAMVHQLKSRMIISGKASIDGEVILYDGAGFLIGSEASLSCVWFCRIHVKGTTIVRDGSKLTDNIHIQLGNHIWKDARIAVKDGSVLAIASSTNFTNAWLQLQDNAKVTIHVESAGMELRNSWIHVEKGHVHSKGILVIHDSRNINVEAGSMVVNGSATFVRSSVGLKKDSELAVSSGNLYVLNSTLQAKNAVKMELFSKKDVTIHNGSILLDSHAHFFVGSKADFSCNECHVQLNNKGDTISQNGGVWVKNGKHIWTNSTIIMDISSVLELQHITRIKGKKAVIQTMQNSILRVSNDSRGVALIESVISLVNGELIINDKAMLVMKNNANITMTPGKFHSQGVASSLDNSSFIAKEGSTINVTTNDAMISAFDSKIELYDGHVKMSSKNVTLMATTCKLNRTASHIGSNGQLVCKTCSIILNTNGNENTHRAISIEGGIHSWNNAEMLITTSLLDLDNDTMMVNSNIHALNNSTIAIVNTSFGFEIHESFISMNQGHIKILKGTHVTIGNSTNINLMEGEISVGPNVTATFNKTNITIRNQSTLTANDGIFSTSGSKIELSNGSGGIYVSGEVVLYGSNISLSDGAELEITKGSKWNCDCCSVHLNGKGPNGSKSLLLKKSTHKWNRSSQVFATNESRVSLENDIAIGSHALIVTANISFITVEPGNELSIIMGNHSSLMLIEGGIIVGSGSTLNIMNNASLLITHGVIQLNRRSKLTINQNMVISAVAGKNCTGYRSHSFSTQICFIIKLQYNSCSFLRSVNATAFQEQIDSRAEGKLEISGEGDGFSGALHCVEPLKKM